MPFSKEKLDEILSKHVEWLARSGVVCDHLNSKSVEFRIQWGAIIGNVPNYFFRKLNRKTSLNLCVTPIE